MKAILITLNEQNIIEIENKLEALQGAVDGYIETVSLIPEKVDMIVNEEGLIKGMELNPIASAIAGTYIVGNALIVGVDGEDFCDVPDEWIKCYR
jgi:hypothetical protein